MKRAGLTAAVLVFLALTVLTQTQADAGRGNDSRAAAAMLNQYETVFYTNTDLSSHFSSFKGLSRQTAGALSIPFGDLIYGLDLLDPHASADMLAKSEAVLIRSGFQFAQNQWPRLSPRREERQIDNREESGRRTG